MIEFFINTIENRLQLIQCTTIHKLHLLCKEFGSCGSHLHVYIISLLCSVYVEMLELFVLFSEVS